MVLLLLGAVVNVVFEGAVQGVFRVLFGWMRPGPGAGLRPMTRRGFLKAYRKAIPQRYDEHRLVQDKAIAVNDLYVELQYLEQGHREELRSHLTRHRAVLVLGEAGAGKTLLLKRYLLRWAERRSRTDKIPVMVELHECTSPGADFVQMIAKRFVRARDRGRGEGADLPRQFVEGELAKGNLLVLFDGLDEVGAGLQQDVSLALREFWERYVTGEARNSMIVTCRTSALTGDLGDSFHRVDVPPFDDASILEFLEKWIGLEDEAAASEDEPAPLRTADELFAQIKETPTLAGLVRSPLLLSLLAELYTSRLAATGRALPSSRAAFFRSVVQHMLTRDTVMGRDPFRARRTGASVFDLDQKLTVLKRIALAMTLSSGTEDDRLTISSERLVLVAQGAFRELDLGPAAGRRLLAEIIERSRLLERSADQQRFRFQHRSFQEFCTALALGTQDRAAELLRGYRSDPRFWRDTVRYRVAGQCSGLQPGVKARREIPGCSGPGGHLFPGWTVLLLDVAGGAG